MFRSASLTVGCSTHLLPRRPRRLAPAQVAVSSVESCTGGLPLRCGMSLPIVQVDAFTDRPFAGNPAAVCVLPVAADAAWMQAVAREMNLSETAFLVRREE